MRSIFYNESTLRKLLCKPNYRLATEDENNIVCETDCSNCDLFYFGESKWTLKRRSDEHMKICQELRLQNE